MPNTKLLKLITSLSYQGCIVEYSRIGCCKENLNVRDNITSLLGDDWPDDLPKFKCRCAEMVKERNLSAFATHTQHAQKGRLTVLFIKHEKIYRFYTNLEIV